MLLRAAGRGLLLKGLIAVRVPGRRRRSSACSLSRAAYSRARPGGGFTCVTGWRSCSAIAAPWHVLATLRNPPYFDFTMHSGPGQYHGFFWFYFINEHVLRFLNLRYPRDYKTVPRL